jgi:hypothetical protein
MAILATAKQINYIKSLIEQNNYLLMCDLSTLEKSRASALIEFLAKHNGDYDDFRDIIRIKGPKIPNLVGDFLYEDR